MGNKKTREVEMFGEGFSPLLDFQKKYNIFVSLYDLLYDRYLKYKDAPEIIKEVEFEDIYKNANIYYVFPFEDLEFISIQDKFRDRLLAIMSLCNQSLNPLNETNLRPVITQAPKKTIYDYIQNILNKTEFIQELKETFKTEKGKSLKVIISILEKEDILIIPPREFKNFYLELSTVFQRDLGSYNSIQNVNFEDIHKESIKPITQKLNSLIIKYKNKQ